MRLPHVLQETLVIELRREPVRQPKTQAHRSAIALRLLDALPHSPRARRLAVQCRPQPELVLLGHLPARHHADARLVLLHVFLAHLDRLSATHRRRRHRRQPPQHLRAVQRRILARFVVHEARRCDPDEVAHVRVIAHFDGIDLHHLLLNRGPTVYIPRTNFFCHGAC